MKVEKTPVLFKSFLKLVFSIVFFFQANAVWSQPGNALNFDGYDDNIVTTLNVDQSVVPVTTWEAWVYPTTNDAQWRMIMSIEDGGWDRFVAMNGGNFYVGIGEISGGWLPVSMDVNKWQHIAVVFNEAAGMVYFYKNGVQYSHALTSHSSAVNFGIGCSQQAGPTQFYQGSIDEVRVWNVGKSQAEILASMGTELVGNEANLLAYYNFNQGGAGDYNFGLNYLTDQSGHGYTGTMSNFGLYGPASNWLESYAMVVPTSSPATDITTTGFTANWTAPATGTADNYVLDVATDPTFTNFVNGYNALTVYGTSWVISGLSAGTYYYRVSANKSSVYGQGGYSATITLNVLFAEPSVQASTISFTAVGQTNMTVSWINGNGNRRAVFMKEGTGAITNPVDGVGYTPSADWNNKGTQLGSSGYYCIYDGTGSSVDMTNLSIGSSYTLQAFEYNSSSFNIAIGQPFQGGIIAYILQPGDAGYDAALPKGMITELSDNGAYNNWFDAYNYCSNLTVDGYSDWYLPSLNDLSKIYANINVIGGVNTWSYWSSDLYEYYPDYYAYYLQMWDGQPNLYYKWNGIGRRAVRSFSASPITASNNYNVSTASGNPGFISFSGYIVTYDGNGATAGYVPSDPGIYTSGASVTVKANTGNLSKTGYLFGGWNTAANGIGTNYAEGSYYTITGNVTLYARWGVSNTVSAASPSPALCFNAPLANITHVTTGATGISNDGVSGANGLPVGISATWSSNTILISGAPELSGVYNYSIPLTGGFGNVSAIGTITIIASPIISASNDGPVCSGASVNLTATPVQLGNYTYSTVAFAPVSGTPTPLVLDDEELSGAIDLPFPFTFYGNTYTSIYVSSNGFVSFDPDADPSTYGQALPDASNPNNLIALNWEDLNPSDGGSIGYFSTGDKFVIQFDGVYHYDSDATITGQIVLNANGTIDIHANNINSDYDGDGETMGIENADGTSALAIHNYDEWTDENVSYHIYSQEAQVLSYLWNGGNSPTTASNTANPSVTTTYSVTATNSHGCASTPAATTVTVNPSPEIPIISASGPTTFCAAGSTVTLSVANAPVITQTVPLDLVPGATLAVGLRKLKSSYTGAALRLRRSSDQAQQDFGFDGNNLDLNAIVSWLDGADGYCTTLYDQSGNGGHVTQPVDYKQPLFVSNGINNKPTLHFTTSQYMNNEVNYPPPYSVIYGSRMTGTSGRVLSAMGNNWLLGYWAGLQDRVYFEGWVGEGYESTVLNQYNIYAAKGTGTISTVYKNGVELFSNSNGLVGPNGIELNGSGGGGEISDCDFTDVIIHGSALSAGDIVNLNNSIGMYYGSGTLNPVSYLWSTFATSSSISVSTTGDYSVTVTNANGCSATSAATAVSAGSLTMPSASVVHPTCSTLGSITVTNAIAGNTYSINGGSYSNTTVFAQLAAGNYSITAKNESGCISETTSITVNAQPAPPTTPTTTVTQPTCILASATITVTNVSSGISYSLDGVDFSNTSGIFSGITSIGNKTVWAKNTSSGCTSSSIALINAQPTPPTAPTTSVTQPTCTVAAATITVSNVSVGNSYSIDGVDFSNTSGIFSGITAAGNKTVWAKNTSSGCTSSSTALINAQPPTPAAPSVSQKLSACNVVPTTALITISNAISGNTYSIDGITFTNSTGIFNTVALGTYAVKVKNSYGCISVATPVTITPAIPTAPTTVSASRCGTGSLVLSATAPANSKLLWYTAATGGASISVGSSYITASLSINTTYYVESVNNTTTCASTTRTSVAATINAIPTAPSAPGVSRCGAGTVTLSATAPVGGTVAWYAAATGGTALFASTPYTTASITANTTYYVASSITSTGCMSATRTAVLATVNTLPALATATGAARCGSGSVSLLATPPTGSTLAWYPVSSLGTALATTNSYITPIISANTTYYVETKVTTTGCISATRTPVLATINALPTAPAAVGASRCNTGSVVLTATAPLDGTVAWYAAAAGGTALSTTTSFSTPSIAATTTYYVESKTTLTGCVSSSRTAVIATVNPLPAAPSGVGVSRCGPGVALLTATPPTGTTIAWYSEATLGSPLSTSTSYTTPSLSANTTYYVESTNSLTGCISATRTALLVTVNPLPAAPVGVAASKCGTGSVILSATAPTGGTVTWYNAATAGTTLSTAASYTTPSISANTTYYVEAKITATGCVSATRTALLATINPLPTAPASIAGARCGTGTVILSATAPAGGTVAWYSVATLGTALSAITPYTTPSLSANTTYYVESKITATGCVSATRTAVLAAVNALPAAPLGTAAARCGSGTVTLSATPASGCTVAWFPASTLGTALSTTASFTTPSITASTTYYAQSVNSTTGCISAARTAVLATVNALPAAPLYTAGARCGTGTVLLSAIAQSGSILGWYATATLGTALATTASYTTPSISSTTIYYVESKNSLTGCVSLNRSAVTATINPLPVAPTLSLTQPTVAVPSGKITIISALAGFSFSINNGVTYINTTTGIFSGLAAGTYNVLAKNTVTSCVSAVSVAVINAVPIARSSVINEPTASSVKVEAPIAPVSDLFEVSAYPNPTNGQFKLNINGASSETIRVTVYDLFRRSLNQFTFGNKPSVTLGQDLKAGVYMIEVRQGKNMKILKLVKF